jgi:hypothetical protein
MDQEFIKCGFTQNIWHMHVECKKAIPLQAWIGPEGSRKLRFPDFMTTAQDGGKVVSLMLPHSHDYHMKILSDLNEVQVTP